MSLWVAAFSRVMFWRNGVVGACLRFLPVIISSHMVQIGTAALAIGNLYKYFQYFVVFDAGGRVEDYLVAFLLAEKCLANGGTD